MPLCQPAQSPDVRLRGRPPERLTLPPWWGSEVLAGQPALRVFTPGAPSFVGILVGGVRFKRRLLVNGTQLPQPVVTHQPV